MRQYTVVSFFILISTLGLFGLSACKKDQTLPVADLKKSYFPLKLHTSITYLVDSIAYDDFTGLERAFNFQIKDSIVSEVESEGKNITVYIERYKRKDSQEQWKFQKVLSRSLIDLRAEEFIENRRFVKFIFPPSPGRSWNVNTYNNIGEQTSYFQEVDVPKTINGLSLDSTATIIFADENNLIEETYSEEVYCRNIGLVSKEVKSLEKDFYTQKIKSGFKYTMRLLSR